MKQTTYPDGDWSVIGEYQSEADASIVKGMLETNGVPVIVNNGTISSVYPMTMTWAPVQLLVPDNAADTARRLLKQTE